ncbi:polyphenol oxidase family protein [bacterium]|nr:polyphenol oxidase family protein [bacterium]
MTRTSDFILRPRIFEDLNWLTAGMTCRGYSAPDEIRLDAAGRLPAALGFPECGVVVAEQVHGAGVALVTRDLAGPDGLAQVTGADGLVTTESGLLIGVFTADCVPVAVVSPETRHVAVIHAGREGVRLGIVGETVRCLTELGARISGLRAWIGPCVCGRHYEVSAKLAAPFRERYGNAEGLLAGPEKRHLDLRGMVWHDLLGEGLMAENIETDPQCTYEDPARFYSYRRDGQGTGRLFTFLLRRD